jgi:hypothetical protein
VTPEQTEIARAFVACEKWQWMPGMLVTGTSGVSRAGSWSHPAIRVTRQNVSQANNTWLPDITDPATLGCILALVREAWGSAFVHMRHQWTTRVKHHWYAIYWSDGHRKEWRGDTEAAALLAALQAAP